MGDESFRLLFENSPDAMMIADDSGKYIDVNPAACDLFGYSRSQMLQMHVAELVTAQNPGAGERYQAYLKTGKESGEFTFVRAGEEIRSASYAAFRLAPGQHLSILRDITERKQTEERLQRQAYLTQTITDTTANALIVMDAEGRTTFVNPAGEKLFGFSMVEFVGRIFHNLVHHHRLDGTPYPASECPLRAVLRHGIPLIDHEDTFFHKDGSEIAVLCSNAPIIESGAVTGAVLSMQDVTERRQVRNAMRESESRFRTMIEQSPFSIQILAPEGKTRMVNRAWEQLWGLSLDAIADYNMLEDPQLEAKGILSYIRRGFAGEATVIPPIMYDPNETLPGKTIRQDPKRWVEAYIYPVIEEAGSIREVILVHQDITERVDATEELRHKAEEIEALNMRLQRSIKETQHRVKNNLQLISNLVELQTNEDSLTVPVTAMRRIGQHARSLAAIHELITAQIKKGANTETLSCRAILESLIPLLQAATPGRSIRFQAEEVPLPIRECASLALLVSEVISNASKHGQGDIELTFAWEDNNARLEICDNGPGFAPDFDPATDGKTGLLLIDSTGRYDLGGTISYANRPEGGARVSVHFPLLSLPRE